jgi:hypothetical protein
VSDVRWWYNLNRSLPHSRFLLGVAERGSCLLSLREQLLNTVNVLTEALDYGSIEAKTFAISPYVGGYE